MSYPREKERYVASKDFLRGLFSHLLIIERSPARFHLDTAAFNPTELLKALSECA